MLIYEIFEAIKFRCDYAKILGLINSSDKLVLKNKPDKQYYIDYNSKTKQNPKFNLYQIHNFFL